MGYYWAMKLSYQIKIIVFVFMMFINSLGTSYGAEVKAELVKDGLDWPTSIAFDGEDRIFVSLRYEGEIRILQNGELQSEPFAKLEVAQLPESGLLGIALDPDFAKNRFVYFYYTYEEDTGDTFNRVARLKDENGKGVDFKIILDEIPASNFHNGGILAFGPDKKLYITTGDAREQDNSQDKTSLAGKVLRIDPDGSIPDDNPFPNSPVYSYGHRNVFGITFDPGSGVPIITENGPESDDEINAILPGKNYGWPMVKGSASENGLTDPIYVFRASIAPTGIAYYSGNGLPKEWANSVFFGDWNNGDIHRLGITADDTANGYSVVYKADGGVIDVEKSPDNHIYFTTQNSIFRLVDAKQKPSTEADKPENKVDEKEKTNFVLIVAVAVFVIVFIFYFVIIRRPLKKQG